MVKPLRGVTMAPRSVIAEHRTRRRERGAWHPTERPGCVHIFKDANTRGPRLAALKIDRPSSDGDVEVVLVEIVGALA